MAQILQMVGLVSVEWFLIKQMGFTIVLNSRTSAVNTTYKTGLRDCSGVFYSKYGGANYLFVCESQFGFAFGVDTGSATNPYIIKVYKHISESFFIRKCKRESSFLKFKASERLTVALELYPGIQQKVSQLHIASYLGIKPETLSRVKLASLKTKSTR